MFSAVTKDTEGLFIISRLEVTTLIVINYSRADFFIK